MCILTFLDISETEFKMLQSLMFILKIYINMLIIIHQNNIVVNKINKAKLVLLKIIVNYL